MPMTPTPAIRFLRRGLAVTAVAAVAVLAGCETPPEAPPPAPPPVVVAAPPPPVTLNQGVAESAAIYVAFIREASTIRAGFPDADSIQAAMQRGAAYQSGQLSRGLIAYASILALQSPEFVAGLRGYAADPTVRQQVVYSILSDPNYAASLPGADAAAGLISTTIGRDAVMLTAIADAVEGDAYTIQERRDPRRRWATTPIANREVRLERAKSLSAMQMLPSPEESARLFAAAHAGSGLGVSGGRASPPYTPVVARALSIAALAALGAAGEDQRANTDILISDPGNQFCFDLSKLNLFQCLAASRPSYEDMFCIGRHIVRDLATCAGGAVGPAPAQSLAAVLPPGVTPGAAPAATTASLNGGSSRNN